MQLSMQTRARIDLLEANRTPLQESRPLSIDLPSYTDVTRERLRNVIVSNIWWEDRLDARRVFRPTMDRHGPGSHLSMPLSASWMSSGPQADGKDTNVVAFPTGVDRTFVDFMERLGVLGRHTFVDFYKLGQLSRESGKLLYSVDDLPSAWDAVAINRSETHRLINTKKFLRPLSAWAAPYETVDLTRTTPDDFTRVGGGGRVYVKLNNTENTGDGVRPVDSVEQYVALVAELRAHATKHNLDTEICLQTHIQGRNHSFQYVMRPGDTRLGLIALSNQRVEADGVTYAGNENLPLTPDILTPEIAAVMTDMAARIRRIDPQAFGCVMCDYFTTEDGRTLTFDPGLRPTGNTATALARMFIEEQTGKSPLVSEFFFVPTTPAERDFSATVSPLGDRTTVDSLEKRGYGVLPWGYNQYAGRGPWIAVGMTQAKLREAVDDATGILKAAHG
ncbi:MAG: hypothetical protein G01um101425_697 [Candidatus Peregrinibacteria bacterium Gr01-1014_25]|nr:MAG: hypothetical protein G01um101425_697 [Candidatus Peregrinibacteria bacterium Gr01-1014_25]